MITVVQAHNYIVHTLRLDTITHEVADAINNIRIKFRDTLSDNDYRNCENILKKFQENA